MRTVVYVVISMWIIGLAAQQPVSPTPTEDAEILALKSDNQATLDYANELLASYNPFQSYLTTNPYEGTISFNDKFSILTAPFSAVEFRADKENMAIFCKDSLNCLRQLDAETMEYETNIPSYTFGIKMDGKAIPQRDKLIRQLNAMLTDLAGPSKGGHVPVNPAIEEQIQIINRSFNQYNDIDTTFSVKDGGLMWRNRIGEYRVPIEEATFYIDYKNQRIVIKCIEDNCILGNEPNKGEYALTLRTKSNTIAPDIELVLGAFNTIRKELLR